MKTKISKKSVDSIKKRKTRRVLVLVKKNNKKPILKKIIKKVAMKKIVKSPKHGGMIKKSINKILAILLIIGLNWAGISAIGGTRAYFNDVEMSEGNSMTAGTLDFELSSESDFTPEITPTQNSTRTITVKDYSTMDYNYKVRVENVSGNLCDDLFLNDGVSGGPQALNAFVSIEVLYSAMQPPIWTFDASLISGSSDWEGKSCYFDFVFEGWQDNILFGTGGFSDVEIISNVISNSDQPFSSCMKINEVYYNIDASHGNDPNDEWIELYNSCEYKVNIKDWYLEDNNGHEDLNHNYPIDGHQFVVIAANASTWKFWPLIPSNAVKIALGSTKSRMFSYGLRNDGDAVILYDKNGNQIDEVSWGDNVTGLNPAVLKVAKGHSISRKPKGYDTNAASDWMDTYGGSTPQGPNPGTNPHSADGTLLLPPPIISSIPETIIEPIIEESVFEEEIIETEETEIPAEEIAAVEEVLEDEIVETEEIAETEEALVVEEEVLVEIQEELIVGETDEQEPVAEEETQLVEENFQQEISAPEEQAAIIEEPVTEPSSAGEPEPDSEPEPDLVDINNSSE